MSVRLNWGSALVLVYATFACSTVGFVAFAMSRPADLVSADYYERSLQQDARIEAIENARRLTHPVHVVLDAIERRVVITWPTALSNARGEVTLYRPSNSAADCRYPVTPLSGMQVIDVSDLAPGRWRWQAAWTADGRPFYQEDVLTLP